MDYKKLIKISDGQQYPPILSRENEDSASLRLSQHDFDVIIDDVLYSFQWDGDFDNDVTYSTHYTDERMFNVKFWLERQAGAYADQICCSFEWSMDDQAYRMKVVTNLGPNADYNVNKPDCPVSRDNMKSCIEDALMDAGFGVSA